jgi:oligopeptide/dipeptide ABC transporter ATP-binding protein
MIPVPGIDRAPAIHEVRNAAYDDILELLLDPGITPSLLDVPPGCVFYTRCPKAMDVCKEVIPAFRELKSGHWAACHLHGVVAA